MRRFLFLSHTAPPDGAWGLDDLPGQAGRVDVLCRNVQAAFHVSHGLRDDVEVFLVFAADPARPTAIRLVGAHIQHLNPDERSTAARIQQALRARPEDPWWEEVQPGLHVAPFSLGQVLDDLESGGIPVLLDPDGAPVEDAELPGEALFLLSDHVPFTAEEYRLLDDRGTRRVSLGDAWYHGNHAVAVVQWVLDRRP